MFLEISVLRHSEMGRQVHRCLPTGLWSLYGRGEVAAFAGAQEEEIEFLFSFDIVPHIFFKKSMYNFCNQQPK